MIKERRDFKMLINILKKEAKSKKKGGEKR